MNSETQQAPLNSSPRSVAVIGGGISGLAAALELQRRDPGIRVAVFESSDRPGGVLQTEEHEGLRFELGPDSILRRLPWGVELCQRVGLGEEMIPTQPEAAGVYTVYRGRLVRMPEGLAIMAPRRLWPMISTPILSLRGKLRMASERLLPRRRSDEDESLADFTRRRFGREALERIVQPLAGGIYMGDPELLGMQAAFPQFVEAERTSGSLIKSTRRAIPKTPPKPGNTLFTAPRLGFGQLVGAIVERLPEGVLRLGHRVERLASSGDGWRVEGSRSVGEAFTEQYDGVVIATPAGRAGMLLAESDARLGELLGSIRHTSCVVVNLAYPAEAVGGPLDATGIIVPNVERRVFTACTFSSVKYSNRAPQGTVLLRIYLGGAHQPGAIDIPDDEVLSSVRRELHTLMQVSGEPLLARITRWRDSMPQYHVGHLGLVNEIERRVAELPGLELTGNAFRGVGIPHCIRQATQAVDRLLSNEPQSVPA